MKNTKLIGLVALLVVVVLVVSVVIATSADNANMGVVTDKLTSYEQQIAKLNETIEKLNAGLIDANKALEELKAAGVVTEDFNEATASFFDKLEELGDKVEEYEDAEDENGNVILNKNAYHDYAGKKDEILTQAQIDLFRATSVAAMDEIIAKVIEDLKALPTLVQEYTALVAAIEKDGVTIADKEDVATVVAMGDLSWELFDGADDDAKKAAKKALDDKFAAQYTSYKQAATAEFVAMVAKLPKLDALKLTDEKALDDARAQYAHLTSDLGLVFVAADDAFKSEATLATLELREIALAAAKADADLFNESVKTWFDALAGGVKFGLNNATLTALNTLEAKLEEKIEKYETDLAVNLDSEKPGFNEYVYNFLNHDAVAAYRTKYEGVRANLSTLADAYKAAVEALGKKTTYADLTAANTAAHNAWFAITSSFGTTTVDAAQVDTYLELTENTVVAAKAAHAEISTELAVLATKVNNISTYLTVTIHDVVCQKPNDTTHTTCDCTVRAEAYNSALTLASIRSLVEANLLPVLSTDRHFTEDVIGADLLASLKAAYVAAINAEVKGAFDSWKAGQVDTTGAELAMNNVLGTITADSVKFEVVHTDVDEDGKVDAGEIDWTEAYKTFNANVDYYATAGFFNANK